MDQVTKQQIKSELSNYVANVGSMNKARKMLQGVSVATVSNMMNGKWDNISDEMWRSVGKQIGYKPEGRSETADTTLYRTINNVFDDARQSTLVFAVIAREGRGKTYTMDSHKLSHKNTYTVKCSHYFTMRDFLQEVLKSLGIKDQPYKISDMMRRIVSVIRAAEDPLLVIDEFEKVRNEVFYFFVSFCNELKDKCGIVLLGTPYLEKRISDGMRKGIVCYAEIHSRLGGRFVKPADTSIRDAYKVAKAKGIDDELEIASIVNDSDGDLRRVDRLAFRVKKEREVAA